MVATTFEWILLAGNAGTSLLLGVVASRLRAERRSREMVTESRDALAATLARLESLPREALAARAARSRSSAVEESGCRVPVLWDEGDDAEDTPVRRREPQQ